jgi:tRNA(Leu) C34 or U34 (ribose-2'-O)-methylase TrmL
VPGGVHAGRPWAELNGPELNGPELNGPELNGPELNGPELSDPEEADATPDLAIGVGPHPLPWPDDDRLDPELLAGGDRRNVVDRYRYWRVAAIVADLDQRRHPFAVAIENWQHDANIGTVVRTANAFLAAEVVIVGRRRWNRRGAMVTDRYQHLVHCPDVVDLAEHCRRAGRPLVAIDNLPGADPIETAVLPREVTFLFGQEGPGLTDAARAAAGRTLSIAQFGSTRSINAGVAAGIAMHAWIRQHAR